MLRHRLRTEEQRQQKLAEALAQLGTEEAARKQLADLQNQYREELKRYQTGRLNPVNLVQINLYLADLDRKHKEVNERIVGAQEVVVEQRDVLAQAVRERQVLENLKARDYRAFRKDEQRRDQVAMDEMAARGIRRAWRDEK